MARSRLLEGIVTDLFPRQRHRWSARHSRSQRRLHFESLEERRLLATISVTSLNDNLAADGQVTLREAIQAAELNISVDGSTAGSAVQSDIVEFAANLSGSVNLSILGDPSTVSALVITTPITIQGNNTGVTVRRADPGTEMRLFRVAGSGNLTIASLTLAEGVARGANGSVGAPNGADGRGGAVFNDGMLTIMASTLTNNRASGGNAASGGNSGSGLGGAIYNNGGTVTIKNVTISGNSVETGTGGGGLRFGGGMFSRNGTLSIFNSTITNNSASTGRGVYLIGVGGTATGEIRSSIISSADVALGFDLTATFDVGGTVHVTGSHNLIVKQNDFPSITYSSDDPQLGALMTNGGPTATHALAATSPAVNHGVNPLNFTTDQRGGSYMRASNGVPDIGAFELQVAGGPALPGDYNGNSVVDAADYIVWRQTLNTAVTPNYSGADGDGDGQITPDDHNVWRANFGHSLGTSAGVAAAIATAAPSASLDVESPRAANAPNPADSSVAVMVREAVFSSRGGNMRLGPAKIERKTANFLPVSLRGPLESIWIDIFGNTARVSRETGGVLSPKIGRPSEAADALAVEESLADWPVAIPRAFAF
jgi:hypothetical protein